MSHGADPAPERIVLVGFMAAGKSTVGALLAEHLDWQFLDLDRLIEDRTGQSPGRLIRERGEAAFRELEAELTGELAGRARVVIAPGGGWVTRPELADRLGPGTVRVWLTVTPETALERAASGVDRPLLGPIDGRLERARALLREREPYYRLAEARVSADDRTAVGVVEEILRQLGLDREDDEG
jgi:shikimate kinase